MLGIVFSEFLEMVEDKFSDDMVDNIIDDAGIENDGAYTSVGSYDHNEILALVTALSERSGIDVPTLVRTFGKHLLGRFVERYPVFFEGITDPFDFLKTIDQHIHKEVRKLYPEAQLPRFEHDVKNSDVIVMTYSSERPFSELAHGLIEGTMDYFNQPCSITVEDNSTDKRSFVMFTITKK